MKRDKLLWYGDSGWQVYLGILPIDNGHRDRLPKRRIISSIGMFVFYNKCSYFLFIRCESSLGERYGLRIIPGKNSFLVLPNNVSRSTAVGAILHPGGPARSPLTRNGHHHQRVGRSNSVSSQGNRSNNGSISGGGGGGGWSGTSTPRDEYVFSFGLAATAAAAAATVAMVVAVVVSLAVQSSPMTIPSLE